MTQLVEVSASADETYLRRCCCLPSRSERLAKYNQLLRIEEELGADAEYAGDNWRHIAIN